MQISRRMFGKILPAMPLAAKAIAKDMPMPQQEYPWKACPPGGLGQSTEPILKPLMSHDAAKALALQLPHIQDALHTEALRRARNESVIDPDLAVLKAMSPMAKVVFTRQRRVEIHKREIISQGEEGFYDKLSNAVSKYLFGDS